MRLLTGDALASARAGEVAPELELELELVSKESE